MSIFHDFPVGLFVMQLVILVLLVFLLAKFAWKPIMSAVDDREEGIKKALDAAEQAKKEMQNLQAENDKLLKQAREERDVMLKEAREIKEKMISDAKEEAGVEANKMIENAKSSIEQEKQAALADVRKQVAELSVNIAKKVVAKELSSSTDHLKLVDDLLDEVRL